MVDVAVLRERDGLIIKPITVNVQGFSPQQYFAASRGKAIAEAWRSYTSCFDEVTFRDFLKVVRARVDLTDQPERFGEKIHVCGRPAYFVGSNSQYIQFVRPNSDVILNSHPLDVEPPEARRGTPYYQEPALIAQAESEAVHD